MNETLDAASTNPVPDYATAILGWRSWLVVRDRGEYRLRSLFFPAVWEPHRQLTGACERGPRRQRLRPWRREPPHDAPSLRCSCGVHSAARPETAVAYLRQVSTPPFDLVVGLVSLWGEIIECERGWRAEHAYPAHLFLPSCGPGRRTDAGALAAGLRAYGVPVEAVECMSPLDLAPALERRNVPGVAA